MATEKVQTVLEIAVESKQLSAFQTLLKRVFDVAPIVRFRQEQEKITAELFKQQRAGSGHAGGGGGGSGGGGHGGAPAHHRTPPGLHGFERGAASGVGHGWGTAAKMGLSAGVGFMAGHTVGKAVESSELVTRGEGITAAALKAIPIVGGALGGALEMAEKLTDKAISYQQGVMGAYGQTGISKPGEMKLGEFGVSRMELPSMLSNLAQQSGLRGDELNAVAPEQLKLEKLTGISAGGLLGAAGTSVRGGGQMDPERAKRITMETVSLGIESGFRKARLGSFVQQMASDLEEMRGRGIMISSTSLASMTQLLATGKHGIQAEAGLHTAKSLREKIQGAGDGNDYFSAVAMKVAMQNGGGGKQLSPYEAALALEKNPEQFMPLIMKKLGGMVGGPGGNGKNSIAGLAMAIRQAIPSLSMEEADQLARGSAKGDFNELHDQKKDGGELGEKYLSEQEKKAHGGLAAAQAEMTDAQIGMGQQIGGNIMKLRHAEEKMGMLAAPFAAKAGAWTAEKIEHVVTAKNPMDAALDEVRELFHEFVGEIKEAIPKVTDAAKGASDDYLKGLGVPQEKIDRMGTAFEVVSAGLIKLGELLEKIPGMKFLGDLTSS